MRFDDRIATALAQPADRPDGRTAQWRQLVDLLAQRPAGPGGGVATAPSTLLRETRGAIDPTIRRQAARALAGRAVAPDLLAFFAEDSPSIAAPLIAQARLDRGSWLALLPRLGPAARALLRHREDLDPEVKHALGAFGPSDFVLEKGPEAAAPAAPAAGEEQSESQIRELVARIEAFRRQRESHPPSAPFLPGEQVAGFRWETGTEGILLWVEGAPRGPLVGQSIAAIAGPGHYGVDGQAAGAFDKRAPFRDARFNVAGAGPAAGDWRISGVPYFDAQRGSFLGYRGTARRPRVDGGRQGHRGRNARDGGQRGRDARPGSPAPGDGSPAPELGAAPTSSVPGGLRSPSCTASTSGRSGRTRRRTPCCAAPPP